MDLEEKEKKRGDSAVFFLETGRRVILEREGQSLLFDRPNFAMSYVRRQANCVAHSIAKASLSHPSPLIFHHLMLALDF